MLGDDAMRLYLDNCCYNRSYGDHPQLTIFLETQAKLRIQKVIKNGVQNLLRQTVRKLRPLLSCRLCEHGK